MLRGGATKAYERMAWERAAACEITCNASLLESISQKLSSTKRLGHGPCLALARHIVEPSLPWADCCRGLRIRMTQESKLVLASRETLVFANAGLVSAIIREFRSFLRIRRLPDNSCAAEPSVPSATAVPLCESVPVVESSQESPAYDALLEKVKQELKLSCSLLDVAATAADILGVTIDTSMSNVDILVRVYALLFGTSAPDAPGQSGLTLPCGPCVSTLPLPTLLLLHPQVPTAEEVGEAEAMAELEADAATLPLPRANEGTASTLMHEPPSEDPQAPPRPHWMTAVWAERRASQGREVDTEAEMEELAAAEGLTINRSSRNKYGFAGLYYASKSDGENRARRWKAEVPGPPYKGTKQLGSFATKFSGALAIARFLGRKESAKRADVVRDRAGWIVSTAQPLISEEALRQAEEEGLILQRKDHDSGFVGVSLPRSNVSRPFLARIVNASVGSYMTAEEAALERARAIRDAKAQLAEMQGSVNEYAAGSDEGEEAASVSDDESDDDPDYMQILYADHRAANESDSDEYYMEEQKGATSRRRKAKVLTVMAEVVDSSEESDSAESVDVQVLESAGAEAQAANMTAPESHLTSTGEAGARTVVGVETHAMALTHDAAGSSPFPAAAMEEAPRAAGMTRSDARKRAAEEGLQLPPYTSLQGFQGVEQRTSLKRGVEYVARPEKKMLSDVGDTSYKSKRTIGTFRSEGEAALEIARFVAAARRSAAEKASSATSGPANADEQQRRAMDVEAVMVAEDDGDNADVMEVEVEVEAVPGQE